MTHSPVRNSPSKGAASAASPAIALPDDAPSAAEFAEVAAELHDEPDPESTMQNLLKVGMRMLGCGYASVAKVHRDKVETAAASDSRVAEFDTLQLKAGQGPDVELIDERTGVIVADTHADQRWPQWSEVLAEAGIRSYLGVRMSTGESVVGVLNLYDDEPRSFNRDDQAVAYVLARHAAVALDCADDLNNLSAAVDTRTLIGQAQGMLMERYEIDPDKAFRVLSRYSQDSNLKVRTVAALLVETRKLPESAR